MVQRIEPGVVKVESQDKAPGKDGLIVPGVPGVKVNVYRVLTKPGASPEKQLLYSDEYQPVDAVYQSVSGVKSKNRQSK